MSTIILAIGNVPERQLNDVQTCLNDFGIENCTLKEVSKKMFDSVYEYIRNSFKVALVVGDVELWTSYLKNKHLAKPENTIFSVDGIKWCKCTEWNKSDFETNIIPKLYNNKYECFKFSVYSLTDISIIEQFFKSFVYPKSVLRYTIESDISNTHIRVFVSPKLDHRAKLNVLNKLTELVLENLYSINGHSLLETVVDLLHKSGKKIALAESYTAGGIASQLASIEGASEYLQESIVCYSNQSKAQRLGLNLDHLNLHGAVNENTAYAMAASLLSNTPCDLSIATTGYASPPVGADQKTHKAGRTYLAIGDRQGIQVYTNDFLGDRTSVVEQGVQHALFRLYKYLA